MYYTTHDSVIGRLLLIGSEHGLQRVAKLDNGEPPEATLHLLYGAQTDLTNLPGFFASVCAAIDAFLEDKQNLELPYEIIGGTALQRAVWLALTKIPFGETRSYSQLAEAVGFPRAVRAVASACAANPLPLVIPCHRVVAKDGSLAGFSLGGVEIKEKLLALEGAPSDLLAA
jgi:AraC family transcriptional regulator of adaptative response/methylated-DNA-[protein]-cysteine methyltransferase